MANRPYGQFCGLARALELVGERWTLLVIRDLMLSPKRFSDLQRGLPRIPSNILTARLKELEQAGVVRRRALPRPSSGVGYELTAYGQELRPILLSLGVWGARSLGDPHPDDVLNPDSLALALQATFQKPAARRLRATFEVRAGDAVAHARVANGVLTAAPGSIDRPDLVIETGPALRELMAGAITPGDALASGLVRIVGDRQLLDRFAEIFRLPLSPCTAAEDAASA